MAIPFIAGPAVAGLSGVSDRIRAMSLSARFALTGSIVMLIAGVAIGTGVSRLIESYMVANTASATALFMDGFIAPLAQELETADTLSPGPARAIEEALSESALGQRVVSVKIWKPGGLIAYAEDQGQIGKRFPGSDELTRAFGGQLVYEFVGAGKAMPSALRACRCLKSTARSASRGPGTSSVWWSSTRMRPSCMPRSPGRGFTRRRSFWRPR